MYRNPGTQGVHGSLFGRAFELELLRSRIAASAANGTSELILVSGCSGAGKSALLASVNANSPAGGYRTLALKAIGGSRTPYFVARKLIASIVQNIRELQPADHADIVGRIALVPGIHAPIFRTLFPEIEPFIGTPPPDYIDVIEHDSSDVGVTAAAIIECLVHHIGFLLVILDDLHESDRESVGIIGNWINRKSCHIAIIAAYDPELDGFTGNACRFRDAVAEQELKLTDLELSPLTAHAVAEAVGKTFAYLDEPKTEYLAGRIHELTSGNARLVMGLISDVRTDQVVKVQPSTDEGSIDYDLLDRYEPYGFHNYLHRDVTNLDTNAAHILNVLSLMPSGLSQDSLLEISGLDKERFKDGLNSIVGSGIVTHNNGCWIFESAVLKSKVAGGLDPLETRTWHARAARDLLRAHRSHGLGSIFEIAAEIDLSGNLLASAPDLNDFANALLEAARLAKNGGSPVADVTHYIDVATNLLGENLWADREIGWALSYLRVECAFASGNAPEAEANLETLLQKASSRIEVARAARLLAIKHAVDADYEAAITVTLEGLRSLGIDLPRMPSDEEAQSAYDAVKAALPSGGVEGFTDLEWSSDLEHASILDLLAGLMVSSWSAGNLCFVHLAKLVELSARYGVAEATPHGLAWFGVYLAHSFGAYQEADRYAATALELVDKYRLEATRTNVLVAFDQIAPWTRPFPEALKLAEAAFEARQSGSDLTFACYACNHIISDMLVSGVSLEHMMRENRRLADFVRSAGYRDVESVLLLMRRFGAGFADGPWMTAPDKHCLLPNSDPISLIAESGMGPARFWYYLFVGITSFHARDLDAALIALETAEKLVWATPAHIHLAELSLYLGLTSAEIATRDGLTNQTPDHLGTHLKKVGEWADLNPKNFGNKHHLIQAAACALAGDTIAALGHFEQSTRLAKAADLHHELGLAHEQCGRFFYRLGLAENGQHHIVKAFEAYARWGGNFKAQSLASEFASVMIQKPASAARSGEGLSKAVLDWSSMEDLSSLIRAILQTIMGELKAKAGQIELPLDAASALSVRVSEGHEPTGKIIKIERVSRPTKIDQLTGSNTGLEPIIQVTASRNSEEQKTEADACTTVPIAYRDVRLATVTLNRIPEQPEVVEKLELICAYAGAVIAEARQRFAQTPDEGGSIRAARDAMSRTTQSSMIGSLAASIAHEVNQPLAGIHASASAGLRWLKKATPNLEEAASNFADIEHAANRMGDVIRAVRALAKDAPRQHKIFNIDEVIRMVASLCEPHRIQTDLKISFSLGAGDVLVVGDPTQIQQVILNLITNATHAMEGLHTDRKKLRVGSRYASDGVEVVVSDNGSGIAEHLIPSIFEPFFTTRSEGMGMGLSICKSIVELHEGKLDLVSTDDQGSTFRLWLPRYVGV